MNLPFRRPNRPLYAKRDRRLTIVIILTVIVIGFLIVGTPAAISSQNTTAQINTSSQITGCRAQAQAKVTAANVNLNLAVAHSVALEDQFLVAIGGPRDPAIYAALFAQLSAAQTAITRAADIVITTNNTYQMAVQLSNSNPHKFLSTVCPQL